MLLQRTANSLQIKPETKLQTKRATNQEDVTSPSLSVFMGHYNEDESPELLPEFGNVHQIGLTPDVLRQAENNHNVFTGSLDPSHLEKDDEIYAASESPPEFANIEFHGMLLVKVLLL